MRPNTLSRDLPGETAFKVVMSQISFWENVLYLKNSKYQVVIIALKAKVLIPVSEPRGVTIVNDQGLETKTRINDDM